MIDHITAAPNQSVAMTIQLPRPQPDNTLQHACRRLFPDPSMLIGKSLDFRLAQLDGTKLRLSALRSKPMLINLSSS